MRWVLCRKLNICQSSDFASGEARDLINLCKVIQAGGCRRDHSHMCADWPIDKFLKVGICCQYLKIRRLIKLWISNFFWKKKKKIRELATWTIHSLRAAVWWGWETTAPFEYRRLKQTISVQGTGENKAWTEMPIFGWETELMVSLAFFNALERL